MRIRLNAISIFLVSLIIPGLRCVPIDDSTAGVLLAKRTNQSGKQLALQSTTDASKTHQVTVGKSLGKGEHGEVHAVTHHDIPTGGHGVVVKQFHANNKPEETKAEIDHLKQVGQLHATGKDEHGNTWAAMHEVQGKHLHDTAAYKHASEHEDEDKLHELKGHAMKLIGNTQLHHAEQHGLEHDDLKWSNVKFKEGKDAHGNPTLDSAHFVDWGKAKQAPAKQGPNNTYTAAQKDQIKKFEYHDNDTS